MGRGGDGGRKERICKDGMRRLEERESKGVEGGEGEEGSTDTVHILNGRYTGTLSQYISPILCWAATASGRLLQLVGWHRYSEAYHVGP
jgi:hypothetical protein